MMTLVISGALLLGLVSIGEQPSANPHSQLLSDFNSRVEKYMNLRGKAENELPRLNAKETPDAIATHERSLAGKIRSLRRNARQGEIFTPEITAEFKRLFTIATSSKPEDRRLSKSLQHSEPLRVPVKVNQVYPRSLPVQSMPPDLLLNLPQLPKGLEYRIDGQDLILLDTGPNLVVDVAPGVVPPSLNTGGQSQ